MGQICFQTTPLTDVEEPRLRRLYMTGIEGIAWEREVSFSHDRIMVDRSTHESGRLFVPWERPDGVEVVLSTTHLREQEASIQRRLSPNKPLARRVTGIALTKIISS